MKRLLILLLVFLPFTININAAATHVTESRKIQKMDTVILSQIRQNTAVTAKNTAHGEYEDKTLYCAQQSLGCAHEANSISTSALTISIVSLLIAVATLFFAVKTYKSQRKTQENTTPVITKENQYVSLEHIAYKLVSSISNWYKVKYLLQNTELNKIPVDFLFPFLYIEPSDIHLEKFYSEDEETNKYSSVYLLLRLLKDDIISLNNTYDIISKQVREQNVDREIIFKEYENIIIEDTFSLIKSIVNVKSKIIVREEEIKQKKKRNRKEDDYINKTIHEDKINEEKFKFLQYIVWWIFVSMKMKINMGNKELLMKYENDNYKEFKKEVLGELIGIDDVIDNTKDKWEALLLGENDEERSYYSKKRFVILDKVVTLDMIMEFFKIELATSIKMHSSHDIFIDYSPKNTTTNV
jgi:hypothetical protein